MASLTGSFAFWPVWASAGRFAGAIIAWASVPPKPKALTAARGFSSKSGQSTVKAGRLDRLTTPHFDSRGFARLIVGGILRFFMHREAFIMPAMPALVSRCPRLDFTEPARGAAPFAPKKASAESISTLSPRGVPVAWHSTKPS
jgi:hypothetical protein